MSGHAAGALPTSGVGLLQMPRACFVCSWRARATGFGCLLCVYVGGLAPLFFFLLFWVFCARSGVQGGRVRACFILCVYVCAFFMGVEWLGPKP